MRKKLWLWVFIYASAFGQGIALGPNISVGPKVTMGAGAYPTTTLDASCQNHNTASPVSCSSPMTVTEGDGIACTADQFSFGTIGGYLSDNLNGPYNAVYQGLFNSDTGHWQSEWVLCNSQGGSITPVMTTFGSTSGLDITCAAFKGVVRSVPPNGCVDPATIAFNPTNGVGVTSTNPTLLSSVTPANGGEAIYAGMANIGPTTPTAGSGFTLLTGATQGIALWPEYSIQTSAAATPCNYTATSDTWFDGCFGLVNGANAGGAVLPFSGFIIDGHGNTNGTTITAGNALSASYNSIATAYTVQNISTMQWVTGGPCPARVSTIYVNGTAIPGNTGVSLQHTANIAGENLKVQMNLNPSGFMEEFYCFSQSGFTPGVTSQYCDVSSIASTPTGDDSTPQFLYEIPSLTAAANASGGNTVYTANANALTLSSVASSTTGAANNGQAVYTGTITGGGSNAFMGKQFLISGFTSAGNNGTFIIIASTTTTLTALNTGAIAETHAATATTGNLGDSTGQGAVSGNNWLAGASVTIAGFTNAVNNGTFTVVSSTPSTVTVNNASGVAETHAATLAVGYVFRMEITNTTTTILSPGVRLPNGTGPFLVDILGDVTNSGVHTLKILNATTGALIGTDTIPVTGLAAGNGGANTLVANFGNQGSCGTGTNVFQYSNMGGSANGVGYPWPE